MNYSIRNTADENDDDGNNKFKLGLCVYVCGLLRHSTLFVLTKQFILTLERNLSERFFLI